MDRNTFSTMYRTITWIIIISLFFIDEVPLVVYILLFAMIFGRVAVINRIYGPRQPQQPQGNNTGMYPNQANSNEHVQQQQAPRRRGKPMCSDCGQLNPKDAKFCQDCGVPIDREHEIPYDEFK